MTEAFNFNRRNTPGSRSWDLRLTEYEAGALLKVLSGDEVPPEDRSMLVRLKKRLTENINTHSKKV